MRLIVTCACKSKNPLTQALQSLGPCARCLSVSTIFEMSHQDTEPHSVGSTELRSGDLSDKRDPISIKN